MGRFSKYEAIYRLSCWESNMAPHPDKVHPGLVLIERTEEEDEEHMRHLVEPSWRPSHSVDLPSHIQARILRHALCFTGSIVRK